MVNNATSIKKTNYLSSQIIEHQKYHMIVTYADENKSGGLVDVQKFVEVKQR